MAALVVRHPAEEQDIGTLGVPPAVADRELGGVDAVVDHPGDRHLGGGPVLRVRDGDQRHATRRGPVEVGQLVVEGPVDGRGHREIRVVGRVEGAHDRVVVHHVALPDGLVGMEDVAEFGHGHADPLPLGERQDPLPRHRTGGITGGVEQDLVAGVLQATGQLVDDEFDPAVEHGGDGCPGWGDQSDPHVQI